MKHVEIKLLNPEEYPLVNEFCKSEGIPELEPDWSKVVAAIDVKSGKVVGIMVCQMQIHVEPIWIKKGYRNNEISRGMSDMLDGYLSGLAYGGGKNIGIWCQPNNPRSEQLCRLHGMYKSDKVLYTKIYTGDRLEKLMGKLKDIPNLSFQESENRDVPIALE